MPTRVLFVCLGNICRSPLAEGIFRHLVDDAGLGDRIEVDSAGTGAWHAGEPPDARARAVAQKNGVALDGQRARKVEVDDFVEFDHVIAMDRQNLDDLLLLCPPPERRRVRLLRSHDPEGVGDVPDPYFGGRAGFDDVFTMIDRCCRALLAELRATSGA